VHRFDVGVDAGQLVDDVLVGLLRTHTHTALIRYRATQRGQANLPDPSLPPPRPCRGSNKSHWSNTTVNGCNRHHQQQRY